MTEQLIGLCRAAGGVTVGTDAVLGEVRSGRAKFVLAASDASERTRKQLADKCNYYHVKLIHTNYTGAALADMLGKRSCCVAAAFTGKGPWKGVCQALSGEDPHQNAAMTERMMDNGNEV